MSDPHTVRLRREFGLRADPDWITAVADDPTSTSTVMGIPLTPAEAADIRGRAQLGADIGRFRAALQHLPLTVPGFGGVWIDQSQGGVIHVQLVAGTSAATEVAALARDLIDASILVLDSVAFAEQALIDTQHELESLLVGRSPLGSKITCIARDTKHNRIAVSLQSGTASSMIRQAEQQFGPRGAVFDTNGTSLRFDSPA